MSLSGLRRLVAAVPTAAEAPAAGVTPIPGARRFDLDWRRVLAVLLLVPFHGALVFYADPGLVAYVKDPAASTLLIPMKDFLDRWLLELLFLIAGSASWFALGRRSVAQYVGERVRRLLVPFLIALVTLVPLMINVRWLLRPDAPSLSSIYERFFTLNGGDLTGMSGTFTPAHLWFILYLFIFSLAGLPIFRLLRLSAAQRLLSALAVVLGAIYLLVLPLGFARWADLLGMGAKDPLYYFLVFLWGYLLTGQPRFQAAMGRYRWLSLALALATTVLPLLLPAGLVSAPDAGWLYLLSQWTWVLAIVGVGHRWLNHDSPALRYASEAAYPFYILHLPVITVIAFYVVPLSVSIVMKYILIVVATSLLTLAVYEVIIKHVGVLRFCFGLKQLALPLRAGSMKPSRAH